MSVYLDRRFWMAAVALFFVSVVHGQDEVVEVPLYTTIENTGVGTVYAPPTYVSFWLKFTYAEADLQKSLSIGTPTESDLRAYLVAQELRPSSVAVYPLHVVSMKEGIGIRRVEIRFSMAGFLGGESGATSFGGLCEKVKAMGVHFSGETGEPEMLVEDPDLLIQQAVQEATKNAYKAAQGVALALGGVISDVAEVRIGDVVWNDPPDMPVEFPTIETVACTVSVTVTYSVAY